MNKDFITFNDLPQVVAEIRDEVLGMKALLLNLQNRTTQQRENRHHLDTPEQVAEYTNIPLATIYQKLANREAEDTHFASLKVLCICREISVLSSFCMFYSASRNE